MPRRRHVDEPIRGRERIVKRVLESASYHGRSSLGRVVVLHGRGGYGKSFTALAMAKETAAERMVIWVAGHTRDRLESGMRAAAERAVESPQALSGRWDPSRPAKSFWQVFDSLDRPWMLVLDNVNDPAILRPRIDRPSDVHWLRKPATSLGFVLVTTREENSPEWGDHDSIKIDRLDPDSGVQVLADLAGPSVASRRHRRELTEHLRGFPLALSIAGAHLRAAAESGIQVASEQYESGIPVTTEQYVAFLDGRKALENHESTRVEVSLARTTMELSLGLLASIARRSGQPSYYSPLLLLLAGFARAPIPTSLLRIGREGKPLFGDTCDLDIAAAVELLVDMGLIEPITESMDGHGVPRSFDDQPSDAPPRYALHDVIHEACRLTPDFDSTSHHIALTMSAMARRSLDDLNPEDRQTWSTWAGWAPHLAEILRFSASNARLASDDQSTVRAAELARRGAWYLHRAGYHHRAESQMNDVLDYYERTFGDEDRLTVDARSDLARIVRDAGNWLRAEALFRSVELVQSRRGWDEADLTRTRNRIANVLRLRGEFITAVREFDVVIAALVVRLSERQDRSTELDLLSSRLNRALALRGTTEALDELRCVLARRRELLGEEHAETLLSRNQLAVLLRDKGWLPEALAEFEAVLELRNKTLEMAEHRDVLSTRNQLAGTLYRMDRWDEAEAIWRDVLELRKRELGPSHPYTMIVMQHLGKADLERAAREPDRRVELLERAESQLRELRKLQKFMYRDENDQVWGTELLLARVRGAAGDLAGCLRKTESVHVKQAAKLGAEHLWTIESRFRLAQAKAAVGDIDDALSDANFVLRVRTRDLAPGSKDLESVREFVSALCHECTADDVSMRPSYPYPAGS